MKKQFRKDIGKYFEAHKLTEEVKQIIQAKKVNTEDYEEIKKLIRENRFASVFLKNISNEDHFKKSHHEIEVENENKEENIKLLTNKIAKRRLKQRRFKLVASIISAAAILLIFFGVWNTLTIEKREAILAQKSNIYVNIEAPTLILADGKTIDLTNDADVSESYITKEDGIIKYNKSEALTMNKLIVPCKNSYSVLLEDGTEVLLNASSELIYPTVFVGNVREVELKGEAYFKVAKSDVPFIVKTKELSVKVYGTEFNLNTNKRNSVETILIKGSVGVITNAGEVMMKPNQILKFNSETQTTELNNVNSENYLAWMNGYLIYDMVSLANVLDDISAWYGVTFIYETDVDNRKIGLSVHRSRKIDELLSAIEDMVNVKFIKEGEGVYTIE